MIEPISRDKSTLYGGGGKGKNSKIVLFVPTLLATIVGLGFLLKKRVFSCSLKFNQIFSAISKFAIIFSEASKAIKSFITSTIFCCCFVQFLAG